MAAAATLGEIAALLGGDLLGDPAVPIQRIAPLESAGPDAIAFLSNPRYQAQLAASAAGCVIVAPSLREVAAARGAALICSDPYLAFARLTQWWARQARRPHEAGVHASAVIEEGAWITPNARVEAQAFVGRGARVEAYSAIS